MVRKSRVCIVGAGVVGQATGRGFLSKGINVIFVDVDGEKVAALRREGLEAYTPSDLRGAPCRWEVSFLAVSTPTEEGRINLRFLEAAARDLGERLARTAAYHLVVVRSTVPPGTTEDVVIRTIAKVSGKVVGRDFGVCMNPEYLRAETAVEDFGTPWIVVIGEVDRASGDLLAEVYRDFDCPVYRVSLREAEMQKYVHNLFNATKITFFNEMRSVCAALGIDAETIFPLVAASAEGMWNPRYGIRNLGPFAGSCLPKDTQAFRAWAAERGIAVPLLETTMLVNELLRERRVSALSLPSPAPAAPGGRLIPVPDQR